MPFAVRALFFAAYRDVVGTAELEIEVPDGSTVEDLVARLRARGRPFDRLPGTPAIALNRTYASLSEPLEGGDEVAFIPPVAGG